MSNTKFKVGDKVKIKENPDKPKYVGKERIGKIGTIIAIGRFSYLVWFSETGKYAWGKPYYYNDNCLEKVLDNLE